MSKISSDGLEQIKVIRNALDSIHTKLHSDTFYTKDDKTKVKDIEKLYVKTDVFNKIQEECAAIADIISESESWEEV